MNYLPQELCGKLNGLTLNEAFEKGLVESFGDNDGNHFHKLLDDTDRYFAIVNGYKVICSQPLMEYSKEERESWLGLMKFFRFKAKGIIQFRLCAPVFTTPITSINVFDCDVSKKEQK